MSVLPPLRIRVRLFAMQREAAGTKELRLEVPLGSTVDDAWTAVVETVPALAPGRASLRFAVNGSYADAVTPLHDGDEVACIPPVSGGSGEAGEAADADATGETGDADTRGGDGRRRAATGSSRSAPRRSGRPWRRSWPTAWRPTRTAAWWRSWAGPA